MSDSTSRVQRRRQATLNEITDTSRALLRAGEDVTISSVATTLGMTPPALYRYVPNLAGLNELIRQAILSQVMQRLHDAANRQTEPAGQLVAAATAFRQWALNNHAEFRAVFAPSCPLRTLPDADDPLTTSEIAGGMFVDMVINLADTYRLRQAPEGAPVAYLASLDRLVQRRLRVLGSTADKIPEPWVIWQFERAWVKFLGVVSFEVFGFLDPEMIVSGDMFVSILSEIGRDLGLGDEIDRLIVVAVETADWTDQVDGVDPLHITLARRNGEDDETSD